MSLADAAPVAHDGARGSSSVRRVVVRVGIAALIAAALAFVVTAIIGAVRWYSPVPLGDSWDGYLYFYWQVSNGHPDVWWMQANEHRLVFSRALFWMDLRWFGGLSLLLSPLNIVFLFVLWGELCLAAYLLLRPRTELFVATAALLAIPCFSWTQSENITWSYQSQFFGAYVFPLAAFLALALCDQTKRPNLWLALALVSGCIAALTMANGTLALPLMIAMVVLNGRSVPARLAALVPVTAAMLYVYFYGYATRPVERPPWIQLLQFFLAFLGAPFAHLSGSNTLAVVGGIAMCIAGAFAAVVWYRRGRREPVFLALLVFLAYVAAAGASAAIRRAGMSLDVAITGRYSTAALSAWATLLVLLVAVARERRAALVAVLSIAAVVVTVFAPRQLDAFHEYGPEHARRCYIGALALDLGVRDDRNTYPVYPRAEEVHFVAGRAKEMNLSVFGMPEMMRAREYLGQPLNELELTPCDGQVNWREPIPESPDALRVGGWAFDRARSRVPSQVFFVDERGLVVGVAFTGERRNDAERIAPQATFCGFEGYVRPATQGQLRIFGVP